MGAGLQIPDDIAAILSTPGREWRREERVSVTNWMFAPAQVRAHAIRMALTLRNAPPELIETTIYACVGACDYWEEPADHPGHRFREEDKGVDPKKYGRSKSNWCDIIEKYEPARGSFLKYFWFVICRDGRKRLMRQSKEYSLLEPIEDGSSGSQFSSPSREEDLNFESQVEAERRAAEIYAYQVNPYYEVGELLKRLLPSVTVSTDAVLGTLTLLFEPNVGFEVCLENALQSLPELKPEAQIVAVLILDRDGRFDERLAALTHCLAKLSKSLRATLEYLWENPQQLAVPSGQERVPNSVSADHFRITETNYRARVSRARRDLANCMGRQ